GSGAGFGGNYNETAGFATVTMLALAPVGAAWGWSRRRPAVAALVVLGLVAAGSVYGPLTPVVGRLPLLSVAITTRLTAVLCLVVPALGGLGVEAVWSSARRGGRLSVTLARFGGF